MGEVFLFMVIAAGAINHHMVHNTCVYTHTVNLHWYMYVLSANHQCSACGWDAAMPYDRVHANKVSCDQTNGQEKGRGTVL